MFPRHKVEAVESGDFHLAGLVPAPVERRSIDLGSDFTQPSFLAAGLSNKQNSCIILLVVEALLATPPQTRPGYLGLPASATF
ncbi:hypothetical protein BKA56DRAFT_567949 [Ilyonectria sp. MPI-CAGE-AT-0026]|nr:hypothetical protein BKA56DRAFT_567949 [Ilyonectria sp. MPI-CAGE-AT-0026]